jgi:hypothetical protein
MEFINLERNILYQLGNEWLKSGTLGPFKTGWIFEKFCDIPAENLKKALTSTNEGGFIELTPDYRKISLTQKGLSKIKVIQIPDNGYLPFPKQLE